MSDTATDSKTAVAQLLTRSVDVTAYKAEKNKGRFFGTPLVKLLAGPDPPTEFTLHKEFACKSEVFKAAFACKSEVFKAAFNSEFKEGQTQTYRLEDVTPLAVQMLVQWLYFGTLDMNQLEDDDDEMKDAEDLALAQLWILGDKFILPQLQNYVIQQIENLKVKTNSIPHVPLEYIFENTTDPNCPLRRLFVEHWAYDVNPASLLSRSTDFPHLFLLEVLAKVLSTEGVVNIRKDRWTDRDINDFLVPEKPLTRSRH